MGGLFYIGLIFYSASVIEFFLVMIKNSGISGCTSEKDLILNNPGGRLNY